MSDSYALIEQKTKDVNKAISETKDFCDSIAKVNKNGSTAKFIKGLTNSKFLKYIDSGFTGASAIFSIINVFTNSKSSTQQILDAITGIDEKIDNLQSLMVQKFDVLLAQTNDVVRITSLIDSCSKLDTYLEYLDNFAKAKNQSDRNLAIKDIDNIKTDEIDICMTTMAQQLNGTFYQGESIMQTRAESTTGDMLAVTDLYNILFRYCQIALLIRNFISAKDILDREGIKDIPIENLQVIDKDINKYIPDNVIFKINHACNYNYDNLCGDKMSLLQEKTKHALDWCTEYQESNIRTVLERDVFSTVSSNSNDIVSKIIEVLPKHFHWLGHVAIAYDDMTGFKKHIISRYDSSSYIDYFHKKIKKDKKNIVVVYIDPDHKHADVSKVSRYVEISWKEQHRQVMTDIVTTRTVTYKGDAENHDWSGSNISLEEVVSNIRSNNKGNSKVTIWMGQRGSHTTYEKSSNQTFGFSWHKGDKSNYYSIALIQ